MQRERPVHLTIINFKFPLAAIVSITHRITGLVLFVAIPFLLYLLDRALLSEDSFGMVRDQWLNYQPVRFLMWAFLAALGYHLCAGIRHIFMDFGWFETLRAGYWTSWIVLLASIVLAVLAGCWLW